MRRYPRTPWVARPFNRNPLALVLLDRLRSAHPGKEEVKVRRSEITQLLPGVTAKQIRKALLILNASAVSTLSKRGTVSRWYTVVRLTAKTGPQALTARHDVKPHALTARHDGYAILTEITQTLAKGLNKMSNPRDEKLAQDDTAKPLEVYQNLTSPPHTPPLQTIHTYISFIA